jgi:hypothetical protein
VDEYLITTGFTKNGVTRMTHNNVDRGELYSPVGKPTSYSH